MSAPKTKGRKPKGAPSGIVYRAPVPEKDEVSVEELAAALSESDPDPRLRRESAVTDDDFIRASDFVSMRTTIRLENTTTGSEPRDPARLKFVEFLERGLVLEVPSGTCAKGDHLKLSLDVSRPEGGTIQFASTARVDALEPSEDDLERIELELLQYNAVEWKKLSGAFKDRQAEIEQFFRSAKGLS